VEKFQRIDIVLFMPMTVKPLPQEFYDTIDTLSFQEIAYRVADAFFGEDVPVRGKVPENRYCPLPLPKAHQNLMYHILSVSVYRQEHLM